jgi:hypothetical protein
VSVQFDRTYFANVEDADLANAVWHMVEEEKPSMPHYRWTMGESETRAIVEYLKQPSSGGGK